MALPCLQSPRGAVCAVCLAQKSFSSQPFANACDARLDITGSMSKFLFTMLPANDLGLPIRLVPIARVLAEHGHDVAMFNPAPAPAKLIDDAGLKNLPMPSRPMPDPLTDFAQVSSAWDVEQMFGAAFGSEEFVHASAALHIDVLRAFDPDVVVDSFGLFTCLAARVLRVLQRSVKRPKLTAVDRLL